MMTLLETYQLRQIECLELWECRGWRLKVYGIAYGAERPDDSLVSLAKQSLASALPRPAVASRRYGVGYAGIHDGRDGIFVFLDWWENENELHHHVWIAPKGEPDELKDVTATGLSACVWDLAVICFEREAWIDAVLANPDGPDVDSYLDRRLYVRV